MEKVNPTALLISQCLQIPLGVHRVLAVGEIWNSVKLCWSNEITVVFSPSCARSSSHPLRSVAFSRILLGLLLLLPLISQIKPILIHSMNHKNKEKFYISKSKVHTKVVQKFQGTYHQCLNHLKLVMSEKKRPVI